MPETVPASLRPFREVRIGAWRLEFVGRVVRTTTSTQTKPHDAEWTRTRPDWIADPLKTSIVVWTGCTKGRFDPTTDPRMPAFCRRMTTTCAPDKDHDDLVERQRPAPRQPGREQAAETTTLLSLA